MFHHPPPLLLFLHREPRETTPRNKNKTPRKRGRRGRGEKILSSPLPPSSAAPVDRRAGYPVYFARVVRSRAVEAVTLKVRRNATWQLFVGPLREMRYRFCPSVRARAPKRRFPAPSLLTSSPRPHFRSPLKLCLGARGPIQTRHHASPTHAHLRSRPPIGGRATWTWNQTDRQRERERERLWRGNTKRERKRERRPPRARSGEPQRLLLFQLSTFAALLFLSPSPTPPKEEGCASNALTFFNPSPVKGWFSSSSCLLVSCLRLDDDVSTFPSVSFRFRSFGRSSMEFLAMFVWWWLKEGRR